MVPSSVSHHVSEERAPLQPVAPPVRGFRPFPYQLKLKCASPVVSTGSQVDSWNGADLCWWCPARNAPEAVTSERVGKPHLRWSTPPPGPL